MKKLKINDLHIEIADCDYIENEKQKFTWQETQEILNKVGDRWRIPNNLELQQLFKKLHRKGLGKFEGYVYWSSENTASGGSKYTFTIDYQHGDDNRLFAFHNHQDGEDYPYNLRLVRNI